MGIIPMEACKLSSTQMRPTHAAIAEIGQSVKLNNKIVFGGLFLVIAVSCATFGLTLGAVELAKEAKVSDAGVLTSMTGQPVKVQCQNGDDKFFMPQCRAVLHCQCTTSKNPWNYAWIDPAHPDAGCTTAAITAEEPARFQPGVDDPVTYCLNYKCLHQNADPQTVDQMAIDDP